MYLDRFAKKGVKLVSDEVCGAPENPGSKGQEENDSY